MFRANWVVTVLVLAVGCERRIEEPDYGGTVDAQVNANAQADANANANANAQANADAYAQPDTQASADTRVADAKADAPLDARGDAAFDVRADADAAAPDTGATAAALSAQLVGIWVFERFDLTDPMTSAKWTAVPPTMKQEILEEAPKASIEFTTKELISRLAGVPDRKATWSIESIESDSELTLKTSTEGRKRLRFIDSSTLRMLDLDKKDAFVTIFTRRATLPVPTPPKPTPAPPVGPSGSASK